MAPRPYSDKSALPTDSVNDAISGIPTQVIPQTPSPLSTSGATTPSPTPQDEVTIEPFVDAVVMQETSRIPNFAEVTPFYPTPGDIMPYDHSLPDFIRQITNQPNLANLQSLSLRVISTLISLHRMSSYLPNLRELDLEGSVLNSLRDIGCSLKNLQILKVGRCQLESLDGTFGLSSLRELYAQKNFINDVSPCSNLPHIRHIDVSGNRIRNISYAGFLSVCSKLKSIVFAGNPATEVSDYRRHVRRILPQLETLDGISLNNEDESKESKPTENSCEGSDSSSTGIPDFASVSPSDSLNNFFDSEEDFSALDKKNKHAKNLANQDQFESADHDTQEASSETLTSGYEVSGFQDEFQNLSPHQNKAKKGLLEQAKIIENRNTSIKQKCTSIQKLDKDIENRSKKSNFFLNADFTEDFVYSELQSQEDDNVCSASTSSTPVDVADSEETQIESGTLSGDVKVEGNKLGAVRKRSVSAIPKSTISGNERLRDETPGGSKLSSGLPVCGNLTAALRNRKKIQNAWEEKQKIFVKTSETKESLGRLEGPLDGSGDSMEIESEEALFGENLLETSRKWREEFRRYRSNNRSEWEEESSEHINYTKEAFESVVE